MKCKKCGEEMVVQTVGVTKHRSVFKILLCIILLFIPIAGWIALFVLLAGSKKIKAESYAICPSCGRKEKL